MQKSLDKRQWQEEDFLLSKCFILLQEDPVIQKKKDQKYRPGKEEEKKKFGTIVQN